MVLLSRCKMNTKLVPKSVKVLKDLGVEIMNSGTKELEAYRQVMEHGGTVYDDPGELGDSSIKNKPCIEQIDTIVDEI